MERKLIPKYEIRRSTEADLLGERTMQQASWRATYPSPEHGVSQEWVEKELSWWLTEDGLERSREFLRGVYADDNQLRLVVYGDDKVKGFIHFSRKGDQTELKALYTDPATFGTGLGRQLFEGGLGWVGSSDLSLEVVSYNARAIRFYEKCGFEIVPGSNHLYKDKLPVVTMIKKGNTK